jgi:riboflavin synthase
MGDGIMFTGIITHVVNLNHINSNTLSIENKFKSIHLGDSISVNGVCLTVEKIETKSLFFHYGSVTKKTTNLVSATQVNIENSLQFGGSIGGHFVTGHIDTTVRFVRKQESGQAFLLYFSMPQERFAVVTRGSISLNGVSLTVAIVSLDTFCVQIIPHTYSHTNLNMLKTGNLVNVEFDILAKYTRGFHENKRNSSLL